MEEFHKYFSGPLFTIIFRPERLKFHPYSILTGDTLIGFVIFCVLSLGRLDRFTDFLGALEHWLHKLLTNHNGTYTVHIMKGHYLFSVGLLHEIFVSRHHCATTVKGNNDYMKIHADALKVKML